MKRSRYFAILIALAIAIVMMFCSRDRKRFFSHEGVVWTTDYHITYEASRDLNDSIQLILGNIDMSVSPYNRASLITAINENNTTRVDGFIKLLLNASRIINQESGGAFDPTVMPLVNAWASVTKTAKCPRKPRLTASLSSSVWTR